ncbi:hypothetical protein [Sorangium sp. So ce542]|uniref:hypothetical protein n=1 Tax=Sorangium sp. So ce542 TaxID=3133316 RepID=UPI003F6358A6
MRHAIRVDGVLEPAFVKRLHRRWAGAAFGLDGFQERRADHLPPSGAPAGAERALSALVRAHARW